jgi:hypothetical protein
VSILCAIAARERHWYKINTKHTTLGTSGSLRAPHKFIRARCRDNARRADRPIANARPAADPVEPLRGVSEHCVCLIQRLRMRVLCDPRLIRLPYDLYESVFRPKPASLPSPFLGMRRTRPRPWDTRIGVPCFDRRLTGLFLTDEGDAGAAGVRELRRPWSSAGSIAVVIDLAAA